MQEVLDHLDEPITRHLLKTYVALRVESTAEETIDTLRNYRDIPDINYLYVVDAENKLLGVLPTRKLLTAPSQARVGDLMQRDPVSISHEVTTLQACELFLEHKFLAYPVIDHQRHLVGVIDVTLFNRELFDVAQRRQINDLFETLGLRISKLTQASSWSAFKHRFPWLIATITSGSACGLISSVFGQTLEKSIIIAFFLTLVLGLSESMSIQSMTVAIQALHEEKPTWATFTRRVSREGTVGFLLALASGLLVIVIVGLWYRSLQSALVVGGSVTLCMTLASLIGLIIPHLLHALRLNFRIAAGPVTLAATDLTTLTCYFGTAWLIFG